MKRRLLAAAAALACAAAPALAAPLFADVMVLMDESGSMAGEQAWIAAQVPNLDSGLVTAGLSPNLYGLIGFGASVAPPPSDLRGFDVATGGGPTGNDPGTFGSAANFVTSAAGLVAAGGTEDGWAAIALANTLPGRAGAARNYILVTDEDRDNTDAGLSYAGVLGSMTASDTLLNAIVNASFSCPGVTAPVLGISSGGKGYVADGLGGFTTAAGCAAAAGSGTTIANYVDLALDTGGAAWNLNILRSGGVNATSFTNAFIAIKIQEITQGVPEPATALLVASALLGLGAARRRRGAA